MAVCLTRLRLVSTSVFSPVFRTSVKTSYMVRTSQNSLEAYRYIDCGSNSTHLHTPPQAFSAARGGGLVPHGLC